MKRVILPLLLLLITACNQDNDINNIVDRATVTIDISLSTDSRVTFDNNRYSWQGGEQLGIYTTSATPTVNTPSTIELRDGKGHSTANITPFEQGDKLFAYTPYNSQSGSVDKVAITIPSTQSVKSAGTFAGEAMPMISASHSFTDGQDISLIMQPLAGILCFNIYASGKYAGEKVSSIRYATSTPIAGSCQYDLTTESLALPRLSEYNVTTTLTNHYTIPTAKSSTTPIYNSCAINIQRYTYNNHRQGYIHLQL